MAKQGNGSPMPQKFYKTEIILRFYLGFGSAGRIVTEEARAVRITMLSPAATRIGA
jgi:hypothetical protein